MSYVESLASEKIAQLDRYINLSNELMRHPEAHDKEVHRSLELMVEHVDSLISASDVECNIHIKERYEMFCCNIENFLN